MPREISGSEQTIPGGSRIRNETQLLIDELGAYEWGEREPPSRQGAYGMINGRVGITPGVTGGLDAKGRLIHIQNVEAAPSDH